MKLAIALLILVAAAPALARDPDGRYADSPYAGWYEEQHNGEGMRCCDKSDGHRYDGAYSLNEDGSVTLHLKEGNRKLPKSMVLTGPNPTGHAVWWYIDGPGWHSDYCFAPGTLS